MRGFAQSSNKKSVSHSIFFLTSIPTLRTIPLMLASKHNSKVWDPVVSPSLPYTSSTSFTSNLAYIQAELSPSARNLNPMNHPGGSGHVPFVCSSTIHRGNRRDRGGFQGRFTAGGESHGSPARFHERARGTRRNRVHREIRLHPEIKSRLTPELADAGASDPGATQQARRVMRTATIPPEVMDRIRRARDAEWTRVLLGQTSQVLTPDEAAKWLEKDRIQRARNVAEARPRRGPVRW